MIGRLFLSVLETSLSTGIMIVLFVLFSPLLVRRYAVKWKYRIWLFLALWLIIPVKDIGNSWFRPLIERQAEASEGALAYVEDVTSPITIEIPTRIVSGVIPLSDEGPNGIDGLGLVAVIWLCGGIAYIFLHIFSYLHYRKCLMKKGMPVEDEEILEQLSRLERELCIKSRIVIWKYSRAVSPMLTGFLKPVLVLPQEEYNEEEMFFIIKHELIHFKRRDIWMKLLLVVANGIHWFNPVVWIMQKEAVIDMEMACDERVVQNIDYAGKKAYAETLFSTFHRQFAGKTFLSTQFQGGKQIMEKRFKNVLLAKKKRSGILLLTGIAVLTMSLGMLVGCSVAESPAESGGDAENGISEEERMTDGRQNLEEDVAKPDNTGQNDEISEEEPEEALEESVIVCYKEGEAEIIPVTIYGGNGYSIYIPDEGWNVSELQDEAEEKEITGYNLDAWTSDVNENVGLEVVRNDGVFAAEIKSELTAEGWVETENPELIKQEGETIYHVRLVDDKEGCYSIYYYCPVEAEEGFGQEMSAIADTFAVTIYR